MAYELYCHSGNPIYCWSYTIAVCSSTGDQIGQIDKTWRCSCSLLDRDTRHLSTVITRSEGQVWMISVIYLQQIRFQINQFLDLLVMLCDGAIVSWSPSPSVHHLPALESVISHIPTVVSRYEHHNISLIRTGCLLRQYYYGCIANL